MKSVAEDKYKVTVTSLGTGKVLVDYELKRVNFKADHNYIDVGPLEKELVSTDFTISGTVYPPPKKVKYTTAKRIGRGR